MIAASTTQSRSAEAFTRAVQPESMLVMLRLTRFFMFAKAKDMSVTFETSQPLAPAVSRPSSSVRPAPYMKYERLVTLLVFQRAGEVTKVASLPSLRKKLASEVASGMSIPVPSKVAMLV